ncbi:MAG: DUF1684 domain-containing protein [Bacteroidales bacterium]
MKRFFSLTTTLVIIVSFFVQCSSKKETPEEYKQAIEEWHQERMQNLKADDGWLNLAGLFWIEEGKNTIGSDEANDITFPDKAPKKLGKIYLKDSTINFEAAKNVDIIHEEKTIQLKEMKSDQEGEPTVLQHKSLKWFIIERDGKYGIRLRDLESDLLDELDSIPTFPIKKEWKIKAEFIPHKEKKTIEVPNVLGNTNEENIPGVLKFEIKGEEYKLHPIGSKASMFLVFGDETNGRETYGGGRFLSVDEPDKNNITYIDFNKAYNPPCAFTPYATCPLPPKGNNLEVKIEAGEKNPDIEMDHH